jgi:hypothetical protein
MMTYNELGAKLILEKAKPSKSKKVKNNSFKTFNWLSFLPFLNFKLDLTASRDWDLDS